MKPRIFPVLFCCLFGSLLSAQEKTEWITDYSEAAKIATAQDKSLLLLFTGDWIPLCQKFEEDILSKDAFLQEASEHFVLVRLNYPEDGKLPMPLAAQNQLLKDAYRVQGFPTVMLTTAEGKPFGLNGFQPVEPEFYAGQLVAMDTAHEGMRMRREEAANFEGLEKAKAIIESIPALPGNLAARYYEDEMKQVIAADPENKIGKTEEFISLIDDVNYSKAMQVLSKESKWDKMLELTDAYIAERNLEGGLLQKALLNKSSVQDQMGSLRARIESLLQVVDIDPESGYGQEAQRQLDALRAEKLRQELEP